MGTDVRRTDSFLRRGLSLSERNAKDEAQVADGRQSWRIGAHLGEISGITLFIGTLSVWLNARGTWTALGLPGELISIRSALDSFSALGFQFVVLFIVVFLFTAFLIPRVYRVSPRAIGLELVVSLLLSFVGCWIEIKMGPRSPEFLLVWGLMWLPLVAGSIYRDLPIRHHRDQVLVTICGLAVFGFYAESLYVAGVKTGFSLAANANPPWTVSRLELAGIDKQVYPLVSLKSKDRLEMGTDPIVGVGEFTYEPKRPDFIRLITKDDANYYFVENVNGAARTLAVRKELIVELFFENAPISSSLLH
jgi:hypothetical protein